jgi:hypothetical protein
MRLIYDYKRWHPIISIRVFAQSSLPFISRPFGFKTCIYHKKAI